MTKFGRSIFITNFANAKQIIMLQKTEKNKYKGHPQRSKSQSKITILTSIEDWNKTEINVFTFLICKQIINLKTSKKKYKIVLINILH